jgi:integrase
MPIRLDASSVAAIRAPAVGTTTVWDDEIRGFGVRVSPSGARSFFLNYRSPLDGRERRHTIGAYPTWSAPEARREAKDLRKRVDCGADPKEERRAILEAPTVQDLADRYEADHLPEKAARSQTEDAAIIKREILPKLGRRRVNEVHHGDIEALHKLIGKRLNRRTGKGCETRANRVLAVLSKMFSLSMIPREDETKAWRSQQDGNPCRGVERYIERGKKRFLSPAEIAALADAIAVRGATPAVNAVKMIMLTGCRPGEAQAATWAEFDREPGIWVKPSAHTKQREEHRIPLTAGALALLELVREARKTAARAKASPYVFPGQKPAQPIKQLRATWDALSAYATVSLWRDAKDQKIAKMVADLEAGLKRRPTVKECRGVAAKVEIELPAGLTDARLYDLRHTFASVGVGGGISLQIIGALLGHTQARTTQRYAHLADDPLREAAAKIDAVLSGAGSPGAEIIEMRPGK